MSGNNDAGYSAFLDALGADDDLKHLTTTTQASTSAQPPQMSMPFALKMDQVLTCAKGENHEKIRTLFSLHAAVRCQC